MLNTPPHLEARDPRGFVSIFHGTSSSVARRRLRASDLSFWQSMPSFDIGRPGLHLQSGASVVFGWCGRAAREPLHRFQSTRPVWGATLRPVSAGCWATHFNPRVWGATRGRPPTAACARYFNPRAPWGRGGVSAGRPAGRSLCRTGSSCAYRVRSDCRSGTICRGSTGCRCSWTCPTDRTRRRKTGGHTWRPR